MISSDPLDSIFNPDPLLKAIATYRLSNFNNIHIEELENVFDFINLFNLICLNIGGCPDLLSMPTRAYIHIPKIKENAA